MGNLFFTHAKGERMTETTTTPTPTLEDLQAQLDAAITEKADLTAKLGELGTAQTARDQAKAAYEAKQAEVTQINESVATERSELVAALRSMSDTIATLIDGLAAA